MSSRQVTEADPPETWPVMKTHVHAIFRKLGLEAAQDDNRRVLAVIAYLRSD